MITVHLSSTSSSPRNLHIQITVAFCAEKEKRKPQRGKETFKQRWQIMRGVLPHRGLTRSKNRLDRMSICSRDVLYTHRHTKTHVCTETIQMKSNELVVKFCEDPVSLQCRLVLHPLLSSSPSSSVSPYSASLGRLNYTLMSLFKYPFAFTVKRHWHCNHMGPQLISNRSV